MTGQEAVGVAQALMSRGAKGNYVAELRGEYTKLAAAHARAQADKVRLPIAAAVSYYGGGTAQYLAEKPLCPIMFHYGTLDAHIPMSQVEQVEAATPARHYRDFLDLYVADEADAAFRRFAGAGMHVVRSTEPIERWLEPLAARV